MRKYLTLIILFFTITLHSVDAQAQLEASYSINTNTCDCIKITIENKSADTFYIISRSYSNAYWDSCFAYELYLSEHSGNRLTLDITSNYHDIDHTPNGSFYISPGTTYKFGARSVKEALNNLYISMYVYAMPVSPGDSKEATQQKLSKLMETPLKRLRTRRQFNRAYEESKKDTNPSGWRSYYCKQIDATINN